MLGQTFETVAAAAGSHLAGARRRSGKYMIRGVVLVHALLLVSK